LFHLKGKYTIYFTSLVGRLAGSVFFVGVAIADFLAQVLAESGAKMV